MPPAKAVEEKIELKSQIDRSWKGIGIMQVFIALCPTAGCQISKKYQEMVFNTHLCKALQQAHACCRLVLLFSKGGREVVTERGRRWRETLIVFSTTQHITQYFTQHQHHWWRYPLNWPALVWRLYSHLVLLCCFPSVLMEVLSSATCDYPKND